MTHGSGTRLGPYEILSPLGAGGMGEVYRAKDPRLGRDVAVKVLPEDFLEGEERKARFEREARILASLNHPGIAAIYSFEESGGRHLLVMELVEGDGLDARIASGPLPLEEILSISRQIAEALSAAHEKGIVHRDLKPANVKVTPGGRVKLLDFGLARFSGVESRAPETEETLARLTEAGTIVGTIPYMSPEQVEGRPLGPATDVFSLGVVLYEMATGRRPFRGDSAPGLMSSILKETPPPPSRSRSGLPGAIDGLIGRCLEKDAASRPSTAVLLDELRRLQTRRQAPSGSRARFFLLTSVGLALVAAIATFAWTAVRRSRTAAFVAGSLSQIERLARAGQYQQAFRLASDVERVGEAGAVPDALWKLLSYRLQVESQPPGARVSYRRFDREDAWTFLGVTPLASVRVPQGLLHWRAELDGFVSADRVRYSDKSLSFELRKAGVLDADMVLVPAGEVELWVLGGVAAERSVALDSFLIDRTEVTSREFARFVAAGGYARPEFWAQEFRDGGRTLPFAEAMARFRDATGRPGPSTWKLGGPPDGAEDLPVAGLSWYEADAYARFAGKELPTLYHWYWANTAGDLQLLPGHMLPGANFEGSGPRRSREAQGLDAHGARDMAGNVREWCANTIEDGTRLAVGGAWTDPAYVYLIPEPRSGFDRGPGNGVRCVKRLAEKELPAAATRPLKPARGTDYSRLKPASNEVFGVLARFYDRQKVPLDARIESTDDSSPHWVKQKVTYAAGYGGERMTSLLYLPRSARPPYQVVLQMAGSSTFGDTKTSATESDIFGWNYADYLIRGGRAVLLPLWKGSYERSDGFRPREAPTTPYREHVAWWVAELRQSIDYLESRRDVDPQRIGYQGISFGSVWAPLFMALEPRLRTGILLLGGFPVMPGPAKPFPPEMEPLNFAPRVKAPVLMLNGRNDAIFPYETSQVLLFRALGTSEDLKRHATFPGGHSAFGWRDELHREGLDWLDRHFGPPAGAAPAAPAPGSPK